MRSYQQTFGAGESKDFQIDAKFFFLFDALNAVTVQFWKGGAPSDDLAIDVLAGFKVRPLKGFDRITITSSAAQTIKFFIATGEGDYDRLLGSIQLIGDVALNAATLAAMQNLGASYGASYKSATAMAANTPDTVFTAGVNTNGAIVHVAHFSQEVAAGLNCSYVAKATAPANPLDGDVILSPNAVSLVAGSRGNGGQLVRPIKIAAGKGLYFISAAAELIASRHVLYTLL